MSGLAGLIHWDGRPPDPSSMDLMMNVIQHRGPDGSTWEAKEGVGLGFARLALQKSELSYHQPVWLPDDSCGIVADARLFNRDDLLKRLGEVAWFQGEPGDGAILLALYERWGVDFLDQVDGDFAFAIWDRKRACLFAASDPFGVKPFFYRWEPDRFIFASEPKQILLLPDVSVEADDLLVGEYLFNKFEEPARTFFKHIGRLTPAHYLIATSQGVVQTRWWNPGPDREIHYSNPQEYFDQFRHLFVSAVAKRLQTDYPVGAHLSGGFDSSSIVAMAADLYQRGVNGQLPNHLPRFETISAIYGDLPCDESEYITAVTKQVPFRSHTFTPASDTLLEGLAEELWRIDSPLGNIQRGFYDGCLKILADIQARTLLDGEGGDELTFESYVLRDLAQRRRFLRLIQETRLVSKTSWSSFAWLLYDALLTIVPDSARQLYRKLRKPVSWQPPPWANPEFVDFFFQAPESSVTPAPRYNSYTQELVYQNFTDPMFHWVMAGIEIRASYHGYEARHPYCDRPLVEFVLGIPFEQRLSGGQWRLLQRRSLAGQLPDKILTRATKARFDDFIQKVLTDNKSSLEQIFFSSEPWRSQAYISQKEAQLLYQEFYTQEDTSPFFTGKPLWRILFLELWLRQFSCYNRKNTASLMFQQACSEYKL